MAGAGEAGWWPEVTGQQTCRVCGQPGYRGNQTRNGVHADCSTQAMIEDFLFLLSCGRGWGEIVARLGRTPKAIERCFDRAGRPDLSTRLRNMIEDDGEWETPGWRSRQLRAESNLCRGAIVAQAKARRKAQAAA